MVEKPIELLVFGKKLINESVTLVRPPTGNYLDGHGKHRKQYCRGQGESNLIGQSYGHQAINLIES